MKFMLLSLLIFPVFLIIFSSVKVNAAASFDPLGDLPGGSFFSYPYAISQDGTTIVGRSISANGTEAFRYRDGEMQGLGDLPGGDFYSQANAVSKNGNYIVGYSHDHSGSPEIGRASFIYYDNKMELLGSGYPGHALGVSTGTNGNELIVVGRWGHNGFAEGFIWSNDQITGIGGAAANAISNDGDTVVGETNSQMPFIYQNGVSRNMPTSHGNKGNALAVSADGSVVVGYETISSISFEAIRYDDVTGIATSLGFLDDSIISSATAVSSDGSVIVGESKFTNGQLAFIWTEELGMILLGDYLSQELGVDLMGFTLLNALGISGDGTKIVGLGINSNGDPEGYVATISTAPTFSTPTNNLKPPMNAGPVTVKKNRVLPLRIDLQDENGSPITDLDITSPPAIQVTFAAGTQAAEDVTDEALSAGWGTEGNQFEYDISTGLWSFNLKTKNYTAPGTYTVSIISGDDAEYKIDSSITATFVINE